MRILITGSSGQIGTNLGLRCLALGHEVLGTDCRPNPWTRELDTVVHDLREPLVSKPPLKSFRPDAVVHLAAHAKVHRSVEQPRLALENIVMAHEALEYCRAQGAPIVVSSSREVYGDLDRATTAEADADFARAASPYSASKIALEAMVQAAARCHGLPALIVRLSNVYGRFDHDLARLERVVPLFIQQIFAGEPVTVFGTEKVLDFTWIDDCVDGLVLGLDALLEGRLVRECLNLASGQGHTLIELAGLVGEALGRAPQLNARPPRVGELSRYVANIDRARRLLGFSPQVMLPEGVRRAVASQPRTAVVVAARGPAIQAARLPRTPEPP